MQRSPPAPHSPSPGTCPAMSGFWTQPSPDSPGQSLLTQISALRRGLTWFSLCQGSDPVLDLPCPWPAFCAQSPCHLFCLLHRSKSQRPLSRTSLWPAPTFTGKWKPSGTSSHPRHYFLCYPNSHQRSLFPFSTLREAGELSAFFCSFGPSGKTLET